MVWSNCDGDEDKYNSAYDMWIATICILARKESGLKPAPHIVTLSMAADRSHASAAPMMETGNSANQRKIIL
jgi:hypothetical protein